ncbi:MAG: AsmA-like C-terminal region-containing protein [Akkermansiaceae bacterium]
MRHRSIFHHLKFLIVLCMSLSIGVLVGGVYYINQSGINDEWRERIAMELENLGVIADFEALRFEITKGLVAKGVRIYSDETRGDIIANLEHLVIDVDKTKLMRGKFRVHNIALKQADISLPIDPDKPSGPRVMVTDLQGEMFLPDKSTIEARSIEGSLAGIRISMDARLWSEQSSHDPSTENIRELRKQRLKFVADIIEEIAKWQWPATQPPHLKLYIETNTDNPKTARIDFALNATEIEKNGVTLYDVELDGDFNNSMITLDRMSCRDNSGTLESKAAYHPATRTAKFEANSTLHLQMICRQLFGFHFISQLTYTNPPAVSCTGTIELEAGSKPKTSISGNISIDDFSFLGSRFERLKTNFSTEGKDVFLTQLHATHEQGELKGRILFKDRTIQYEAQSTLPASSYRPFLGESGIGKTLEHAQFDQNSAIHITTRGTMNRNRLTEWEAQGYAEIKNFSYKKTALNSLSGHFELSELHSRFNDIKADFNYEDYALKLAYEGPSSAAVTADAIYLDRVAGNISIENITGTAWPAPIVRLFVPGVADHIEKYRFHRPPNLSANGTFGIRDNREQTQFVVNLSNPGAMDYTFIGEPLNLSRLQAKVLITGDLVDVSNMSFNTFEGSCSGNLRFYTAHAEKSGYDGDIEFLRLHLKEIGELYKFNNAERGLLTGRIAFTGDGNEMRKFNGEGSLTLEKGNLFSVPMLGPISKLMGTVLRDKNPTEEKAKDASCTYIIRDGVLFSNDFQATTRSLRFTGEGSIDLHKKEIDLLMRMNARGIFGFIAMPLRPFIGLFQFAGTGPISAPEWKTTLFTNPNEGKNHPIFKKPPKADVITE